MIKFLICLFGIHRWHLIERKSYPPTNRVQKVSGIVPFSVECSILGYTKNSSICEYCGKTNEKIDLGQ
jgi:hypothetical protein